MSDSNDMYDVGAAPDDCGVVRLKPLTGSRRHSGRQDQDLDDAGEARKPVPVQQTLIVVDILGAVRSNPCVIVDRFKERLSNRFYGSSIAEVYKDGLPAQESDKPASPLQSLGIEILITRANLDANIEDAIANFYGCLKIACPESRVVRCDCPYPTSADFFGPTRNQALDRFVERFVFTTKDFDPSTAANGPRVGAVVEKENEG